MTARSPPTSTPGDTEWIKIYEDLVSATSYDVDSFAWANAVTQEIILIGVSQDTTTGELSETTCTGANSFTPTGDTKYTLVHPDDNTLSVILAITTGDSFAEETESETIQLLDANGEGGGRKINVGTDFGIAGTLSVQLRDSTTYGTAADQLADLRTLRAEQTYVFLRDPFGGLTKVWFGSITVDRIAGVGTDELIDISFEYHRRVDIYESDGETLWMRGAGLVDGSVTIDMVGSTRRSADVTLYTQDGELDYDQVDGFWYDKVLRAVMGVTSSTSTHEAAIGTFVIDRFGNQNASDEIDLTLPDFSSKLNFGLPFAVSWDENEPIENIIEDLATGGGITSSQLNLPLTGINTEAERAFTAGTDRWRAMYEIASANAYDLYFDADGVLQMDPFTDPATASPQFTFRVGGGSNVASIGRKISPALIRNHIVVTGKAADGTPSGVKRSTGKRTRPPASNGSATGHGGSRPRGSPPTTTFGAFRKLVPAFFGTWTKTNFLLRSIIEYSQSSLLPTTPYYATDT